MTKTAIGGTELGTVAPGCGIRTASASISACRVVATGRAIAKRRRERRRVYPWLKTHRKIHFFPTLQNQDFRTNPRPQVFLIVPTVPCQFDKNGVRQHQNSLNNNNIRRPTSSNHPWSCKKNSRLMVGQLPRAESCLT